MTYRENIQAVCDERGIENPLREDDIAVKWLKFWGEDGPTMIRETPMNRGGRLFFQIEAENKPRIGDSLPGSLVCDDDLRVRAAKYFAELYEHETGLGTHPLLDAIHKARLVDIGWG